MKTIIAILIMSSLGLSVLVLSILYHFLIKIAIAINFPVEDIKYMFWLSILSTVCLTIAKWLKEDEY